MRSDQSNDRTDAREVKRQPTVLVGVDLPEYFGGIRGGEADLGELGRLAGTAGGKVVGEITQKRDRPDPATFIGKGKLEELQGVVDHTRARLVVFDNELSPAQSRNIERELNESRDESNGVSVLDRTELILDIFARHARTSQARMQVELAQLQYMLPRLRKLWSHLERQAGGIGTRGPGETQLETDRRLVGRRISRLKRELVEVAGNRRVQAHRRQEHFTAALIGYTNAGKSTLMRAITQADVLVADRLFATLDATTRRVDVDERHFFLLSDTVGFIRRLPHHLVESFHATLQEVAEADLLLHVVDSSSSDPDHQIASVNSVLAEIVPGDRPLLMVFNKIDLLDAESREAFINRYRMEYPESLFVSALAGEGPEAVRSALTNALLKKEQVFRLQMPLHRMDLVAVFHRTASVLAEEHDVEHCRVTVRMREEELSRLRSTEPDLQILD